MTEVDETYSRFRPDSELSRLNARARESSLAEHVVARVCIGRQDAPRPQMRDHSHVARAYTALGKDGVEAIKALLLRGA